MSPVDVRVGTKPELKQLADDALTRDICEKYKSLLITVKIIFRLVLNCFIFSCSHKLSTVL